jgi:hypothetical protein
LADVEPGFQPGGPNAAAKQIPARPGWFHHSSADSGRQDACRYNLQTGSQDDAGDFVDGRFQMLRDTAGEQNCDQD